MADVDPTSFPADAAIAADASDFEVSGVLRRGETIGVRRQGRGPYMAMDRWFARRASSARAAHDRRADEGLAGIRWPDGGRCVSRLVVRWANTTQARGGL